MHQVDEKGKFMEERLPARIEGNFVKYKDKAALIWKQKVITYYQLQERVLETALLLQELGVEKNTKILLLVEDTYDFITIWLAIWRCNAIPIPLEPKVTDTEVGFGVESSKCQFVFSNRQIYLLANGLNENRGKVLTEYVCYKTAYARECNQEDIALFFYTSGTTGRPKCVIFSHQAMYHNVTSLCAAAKMKSKDVFLTPISPFLPASLATVVLPALVLGGTLVVSDSVLPGKLLRMMDNYQATVFFAVPFIYKNMLIAMENRDGKMFQSVQLWLTSSASMEGRIYEEYYNKYDICIHSIYCSSECGAITYNPSLNLDDIKQSVGKVLHGVCVKILDEDGNNAAPDEIGEIVVRGKNIFSGYYQREELMENVLINNWVRTGDLGSISKDGLVRLEGRISDTVNIAGYLVNPAEVENIILTYKNISDVLVYAEKNADMEEIIAAKIILKNESGILDYDDLYSYCAQYLSIHKIPKRIEIVSSFNIGRYGKKKR